MDTGEQLLPDVLKIGDRSNPRYASIFQANRRRWDPVSHTYSTEWLPSFILWLQVKRRTDPIAQSIQSPDLDALLSTAKEWVQC